GPTLEQVAVLVVDDPNSELRFLVVERARRDDLRSPEGEVAELVDADLADVSGPLDDPGIAGHHALDVGDDDDLLGLHVVAEHDGGRVAATAAESGDRAGVILGEKARQDGDDLAHAIG